MISYDKKRFNNLILHLYTPPKGAGRTDLDYAFAEMQEIGIFHWDELDMRHKKADETASPHFLPKMILYSVMCDLERVAVRTSEQEDGQLLYYVEKLLDCGYNLAERDSELGCRIFRSIMMDLDNIAIAKSLDILIDHGIFPRSSGWDDAIYKYRYLKEKGKAQRYLDAYADAIMHWWREALKEKGMEYQDMSFEEFAETKEYKRIPKMFFEKPDPEDILVRFFELFDNYTGSFENELETVKKERDFLEQYFPGEFAPDERKAFWDRVIALYTVLGEKETEKKRIDYVERYLLFLMAYGYSDQRRREWRNKSKKILAPARLYDYDVEIRYMLEHLDYKAAEADFGNLSQTKDYERALEYYGSEQKRLCIIQEVLSEAGPEKEREKYRELAMANRELYITMVTRAKEQLQEAREGAADFFITEYICSATITETDNCRHCGKNIPLEMLPQTDRYGIFHCPFCNGKLHMEYHCYVG